MSSAVVTSLLSALAPGGTAVALVVLGLLSRRMSRTSGGKPFYIWFFVAAALLLISALARPLLLVSGETAPHDSVLWVLLFDGLPALGISIGMYAAWHYWSWLLAERS
jgi:hypothetical protein